MDFLMELDPDNDLLIPKFFEDLPQLFELGWLVDLDRLSGLRLKEPGSRLA